MAFEAYLLIKGTKQGQFKGESTNPRRKDWIEVWHSPTRSSLPAIRKVVSHRGSASTNRSSFASSGAQRLRSSCRLW